MRDFELESFIDWTQIPGMYLFNVSCMRHILPAFFPSQRPTAYLLPAILLNSHFLSLTTGVHVIVKYANCLCPKCMFKCMLHLRLHKSDMGI